MLKNSVQPRTTPTMNLHALLLSLFIVVPSLSFAGEMKQGDCDWFIKINPKISQYLHDHTAKCWYGTGDVDTIKVSANYEVTVNGKVVGVYGPNLNVFLGFFQDAANLFKF